MRFYVDNSWYQASATYDDDIGSLSPTLICTFYAAEFGLKPFVAAKRHIVLDESGRLYMGRIVWVDTGGLGTARGAVTGIASFGAVGSSWSSIPDTTVRMELEVLWRPE